MSSHMATYTLSSVLQRRFGEGRSESEILRLLTDERALEQWRSNLQQLRVRESRQLGGDDAAGAKAT